MMPKGEDDIPICVESPIFQAQKEICRTSIDASETRRLLLMVAGRSFGCTFQIRAVDISDADLTIQLFHVMQSVAVGVDPIPSNL
jgi:hypothetical protein